MYVVWVPIAIVGLGVLAWAVLAGMPFGRSEPERPRQEKMDVITEQSRPATATVREIAVEELPEAAQRQPPQPATRPATQIVPQPATVPRPEPVRQPPPRPQEPIRDSRPQPQPVSAPSRSSAELSETEALQHLQSFIAGSSYRTAPGCLTLTSAGYKNRGYTIEAYDRCERRSAGRWRIDTLTREVFVQRSDGRFLRP